MEKENPDLIDRDFNMSDDDWNHDHYDQNFPFPPHFSIEKLCVEARSTGVFYEYNIFLRSVKCGRFFFPDMIGSTVIYVV